MRAVTLVLLLAAPLVAQPGSIEGRVLNRASGQPLSGVHIRLYAAAVLQMATAAYGVITDADGNFSVAVIPSGTYTVELERAGFLAVPGNAGFMHTTEIPVRSGEHVTGCQLAMLPLIPIAGRVVDQYGDPMPGSQVRISADGATSGRDIGPYGYRVTDERGQFLLFATPGKYYVVAGPPYSVGDTGTPEVRTDGTSELAYTTTYYPNAPDASSATVVEVKAGGEIAGLEIHMRTTAARHNLTVSGVVTGIPAGSQATISYQNKQGESQTGQTGVAVSPDGRFSLDNRGAGYVRLLAQCSSGDTEWQSDLVEIHLAPPGATDVQLALAPGGAVTGTLEVVGRDAAAAAAFKFTVELSGADAVFSMRPLSGAVDRDGAFHLVGVPPGHFDLRVGALPDSAYVKAILLDNISNTGTLDFSRGVRGPHLKIAVSLKGAQISGEVHAADGGPPLNSRTMVFFQPEANQPAPSRTAAAVVDGRYLMQGLPPGKYKLFAADWPQVTPACRPTFLAAGDTVEVSEGEHASRNLNVVVQEGPNANPKQ